jgi:hypothetical protein
LGKWRGYRSGKQSLGDAGRSALKALGMDDYEAQTRSRRIFDELYGDRFAGQVAFLGFRHGVVYLRVRDGSWVRRVRAFQTQLFRDLSTLAELNEVPRSLSIKVGPAPEFDS